MFSCSRLDYLRKLGRGWILPDSDIKFIIERYVKFGDVGHFIDFGSGTLFWSLYFGSKLSRVYCVDQIYSGVAPRDIVRNLSIPFGEVCSFASMRSSERSKFVFHDCVDAVLDFLSSDSGCQCRGVRNAIWMCDVLHHLDADFASRVLTRAFDTCDIILIKDIDSRYRLGSLLNRSHDLLINCQLIRDVNPVPLVDSMRRVGYDMHYRLLPKFGYPHFLLIGIRRK